MVRQKIDFDAERPDNHDDRDQSPSKLADGVHADTSTTTLASTTDSLPVVVTKPIPVDLAVFRQNIGFISMDKFLPDPWALILSHAPSSLKACITRAYRN